MHFTVKLFSKYCDFSCLKMRLIFNFLIFIAANVMYPSIFDTVGYMYEVKLSLSYPNLIISSFMLLILTLITNFVNIIYRHTFDVCILGVFLPISVVSCQINSNFLFMLWPFISICVMSFSVRLGSRSVLIKSIARPGNNRIIFSKLQLFFIVFYSLILIYWAAIYISDINFNLIDIYMRTYEIRARQHVDGFLGYFIGWFILLFFPLFLCKSEGLVRYLAPVIAFVGAFLIFQAFALKLIFLNFFLVAVFALFFRIDNPVKMYIPQLFFFLIFVSSYFFGVLAHPLLDRFFYLVGLNAIFYMDFFSQNSFMFFEGTKLDMELSNYGIGVGYLIDNEYYQGLGTNASAGFLPTMFADLGPAGVIFASLIIGLLMALIKSMQSSNESFTYLTMIALAFSLMNSSFNMLFFSNGLAFIILFSMILRR